MKNEYKITRELMLTWARGNARFGGFALVMFCLWIVIAALCSLGIAISILLRNGLLIYLYSLLTAIALFKLLLAPRLIKARQYKSYSATYGVTEWIRTTEFSEEEITVTDHRAVHKLSYANVRAIKENGNAVAILMKGGVALRLYKDAFTEGTWEECYTLILKRMREEIGVV